jgi:excisionase family DNA binding protein
MHVIEGSFSDQLDAIKRNTLLGAKKMLDVDDMVLLYKIKKSYLYKMTCNRQIPYYKPNGKQIYFDREEIEAWFKRNRVATATETEQAAIAYTVDRNINGKRK